MSIRPFPPLPFLKPLCFFFPTTPAIYVTSIIYVHVYTPTHPNHHQLFRP